MMGQGAFVFWAYPPTPPLLVAPTADRLKVGAGGTATACRTADKILHSPYMVKHLMETKKAFIAESLGITGGDGGT